MMQSEETVLHISDSARDNLSAVLKSDHGEGKSLVLFLAGVG